MKGLNLSKLQKISADDHTTTFRHPDGHEVKIAHSRLSPKLRAELDSLPMNKAKGFADGGEAETNDVGKGTPVTINIAPQAFQPQPGPVNAPGAPLPPPSQAAQPSPHALPAPTPGSPQATGKFDPTYVNPHGLAPEPEENPQPDQAQAAPAAAPKAQPKAARAPAGGGGAPAMPENAVQPGSPEAQAQMAPAPVQNLKGELTAEQQAWQNDLNNGHIQPKTYHDLFEKKSTLGKIGTIFGLLLGGAGSGLTHQPNALIEMMDREIMNDLEAQKQSKANAQNYYRLNLEHQKNEMEKRKLTLQEQMAPAQLRAMDVETQIKAYTLAQSQMLQSSYHNLVMNVNKMPEGPQKEAAKQQLGMIYSKIGEKINNLNDQAAGAAEYYNMMFGPQGSAGGASDESQFQRRMNGMRALGPAGESRAKDIEAKHFPGLKGQASIELTPGDREAINSGMDFDQKLHRFMKWTAQHSGDISPSDRHQGEAMAAELQGAYRQATHGGVYKEGEQNFISKLIDSEPTKFFNEIRVMPQLRAIAHENRARLNQMVKSKGFEGYEGAQGGGGGSEGTIERWDPKGKRTIIYDAKTKKPIGVK